MAVSRSIKISGEEGTIWSHSFFIFATLVFMAITLVYVWCHINITELNYKIAGEIRAGDRLSTEIRDGALKITGPYRGNCPG